MKGSWLCCFPKSSSHCWSSWPSIQWCTFSGPGSHVWQYRHQYHWLATSCMMGTGSSPGVMQPGYGTTTYPLPGQRLQMGWNCNSSCPLCLYRHVMRWPSPLQSVHQPHGTRRSKIPYFWTTKFNPKLKSSCPLHNDRRFKICYSWTKCYEVLSLSVVLNDNANC